MNGHEQRSVSPCLRNQVCGDKGQGWPDAVLPTCSEASRGSCGEGVGGCGEGSPIGYIPEPYTVTKFSKAGHLEYRLMFDGEQIAECATFEALQNAYELRAQREAMEGRT